MAARRKSPNAGDLLVLVGTTKGVFILQSDPTRRRFHLSGPHLEGQAVFSTAYLAADGGAPRILVGNQSAHWGAVVSWSDDFGHTWHEPAEGNIKFPEGSGLSLNAVWALEPVAALGAGVVYAGADPAGLYRSDDRGETFRMNDALFKHPHRPMWQPGAGGLCLHTILFHPDDPMRMYVGISAAGVYRTYDGGESWSRCNRGVKLNPGADPHPEFGQQCVHKMRLDPQNPARIYLQNHPGVYRSDDGGDNWGSIAAGLPSDFGFPLVTHPRATGTAYVIPLAGESARWMPDGAAKVWRTRDAGASWEPLSKGLPHKHAYLTVLRDAFAADPLEPAGLYFGTRNGQLFASVDEGESWRTIADWLPPVLCVKTAVVG
ncbi:MAG: WD40/YVTN/BNR-like repeat-containing protein [Candidatus Binataceae bacterium]